jgi:hypothetical protein
MKLVDRDAALKFDFKMFIRRFDVMPVADQLRTIMHVQMEHAGSKRKRGAEMPAPEPKSNAIYSPQEGAAISVKATQQHGSEGEESDLEEYADNDDSVLSQSSSKAPRKKLQPNGRFLAYVLQFSVFHFFILWHESSTVMISFGIC